MVVQFVAVSRSWVRVASGAAVLVADGILVDGGVGLRCTVEGRRDAVTGFAAIVTVPVIHSTVWILIYTEQQEKKQMIIPSDFITWRRDKRL